MIHNVDHQTNFQPSRWPHNSDQQPGAKEIQLTKGGESSASRKPYRTLCGSRGSPQDSASMVNREGVAMDAATQETLKLTTLDFGRLSKVRYLDDLQWSCR